MRRGGFGTIEPFEQRQRFLRRSAAVDRVLEHPPRFVPFAALEGGDTGVQKLLRLTLAFGDGTARALDIRARPWVTAIEEEGAGPDVDRLVVLRREVMIEADQQELLDLRVAIRIRRWIVRVSSVAAKHVRHSNAGIIP